MDIEAGLTELIRRVVREELAASRAAMPQVAPEVEYLDDRAVARLLSVSRETIQQWRQRGEGPPYVKVGGRAVRYARAEVIAWMDAQTRGRRAG